MKKTMSVESLAYNMSRELVRLCESCFIEKGLESACIAYIASCKKARAVARAESYRK